MESLKLKYFGICVCCFVLLCSQVGLSEMTETIKSDWVLEDPYAKTGPTSLREIQTIEQKRKALQKQKELEAQRMQEQIAEVKAKRVQLIECLNKKGVKLYTSEAPDCPGCKTQRQYFGDDLSKFKGYVNCDTSKFMCPFRGIKIYPTWYFGGSLGLRKEGVKELKAVAKLAGCDW